MLRALANLEGEAYLAFLVGAPIFQSPCGNARGGYFVSAKEAHL